MTLKHQIVDDHHHLPFQRSLRKVPKVTTVLAFAALAFLLSLIIFLYSPSVIFPNFNPAKRSYNQYSSPDPETFDSLNNSIMGEPNRSDASEVLSNSTTPKESPVLKTLEESTNNNTESLTSSAPSPQAESCDLSSGEWVPDPDAPYYTNETCRGMQDLQNCMKFGKPGLSYLKWRWKPDGGCDLPRFDPIQFLALVRGKSITFVGDSLARNQMQSLICLLSRVVYPLDLSTNDNKKNGNQHWMYKDYNFNISLHWSPFLVRSERSDPNDAYGPYNLYLDEYDEEWTTKVEGPNYVVISAAQWFMKTNMFYENGRLIGCVDCNQENTSQLSAFFGYEKAFRTALGGIINGPKNFRGVTFLRTITPTHFEGGGWNQGGDCVRTRPFRRNETVLEPHLAELRRIQVQELKAARDEGNKRGLSFRLIDVTGSMLLRPDGHPGKYGRDPNVKLPNDCTHWCMPGPVDTWNEILLELIRREEGNF